MYFGFVALLAGILLLPSHAAAFERDVHFGLTKWLALQAGFTLQQADALAIGAQRVDSGDMQFVELVSAYACVGKDAESADEVGRNHYPTAAPVPGPIARRVVVAGAEGSRQAALELIKKYEKRAGFMLFMFGNALHAVQDSWAHQGTPDLPRVLEGALACDPAYVWAHPRARGGWNSHNADLTHPWSADVVAMANATYNLLLQYPAIDGVKRTPKPWASLRPQLDGFVRASTKSQKKQWFAGQGIADVSFLQGITLADGAEAFDLRWEGDKLPKLKTLNSDQHHVDPGLLDFFSRFFIRWMSSDDFEATAAEFGGAVPAGARAAPAPMDKTELASRLRAWRVRDHGRAAEFAHAAQPLSAAQRNALSALVPDDQALVHYAAPADGFTPLLVKGPEPSPLMGFYVNTLPPAATGIERAVAATKFRHAPYDTVMVLAERRDGRWRIVALDAVVDH